MIDLEGVCVIYDGAAAPALRDVDLHIPEGELVVVVGPTGSGKSTLLGTLCGLVPHFTGGHLTGRVSIAGRDTADHRPRDLADLVGWVGQEPAAGFVAESVERELAFGMEQQGLDPDVMRRRVEETLDLLGLHPLRHRALDALSGGEQQRVAIGSVLAAHPQVLVLDEPTSALDPRAAEDVLAAIAQLVHDLGITAVVAEHRLERIVQFADRIVEVRTDGTVRHGAPAPMMRDAAVAPPIVELGRLAGWDPLPLSIRDARRHAPALRDRLATAAPADHHPSAGDSAPGPAPADSAGLHASGIAVTHRGVPAVLPIDLRLAAGTATAVMGRNGAGKSSLLWALQGSGPRQSGTVSVGGTDPADLDARAARRLVGLVPQEASDLLYLSTVAAECAQADVDADADGGSTRRLLDRLVPGMPDDANPRDLSAGQRLALVLAIQLAATPAVLLLDEPTRGLDYTAKAALTRIIGELTADGVAVAVSTHDVEFVAATADRVLLLADGAVVADGRTAGVVVGSPVFAPQVAKVMRPDPWLTVADVADGLRRADG